MRIFPVSPRLTTGSIPFGAPDPNAFFKKHSGIDSANGVGTMIVAPCDGVVTKYTQGQYHGKVVQIKAQDGTYPHMFHCSELLLTPGSPVRTGQPVAKSGATGQGITGAHCHFGVSKVPVEQVTSFDQYIDPDEWLKGEQMIITEPEFRRIWSLSGFDVGPEARQPTEKEIEDAVGREFNEFMDYWINTTPVNERITKGAYYDQDVDTAAGQFKKLEDPSKVFNQPTYVKNKE